MFSTPSQYTGFNADAYGGDREAVLAEMMVDHPPAKSRERLRRIRRQMSPAVIDRLHAANVAGLERLFKVAWQAGR
jgi:hypothetical protein